MSAVGPGPAAPGVQLLEELKWVHGMIRRDLGICSELARDVAAGAAPEAVQERVGELRANSPLWRMQVNCLRYCSFVHLHHRHEDVRLFPALRASDPSLEPVVDRLESDHREVAVRLEEIEIAVAALEQDDGEAARRRVVTALEGLGELLLAHLDYEEASIGPTLLGWSAWPS